MVAATNPAVAQPNRTVCRNVVLAASGPELLLINAHDPHLLRRARRVVPVAD
ncbi:hypothetical protein ACWEKT_16285 [Nocardia takedensis]